ELSVADLTQLHRLTEGWVAGVVLAARPGGAMLRAEAGQAFEDLMRQALADQGEEVRTFVHDTAPLERFNPEIARLVSGRADAGSSRRGFSRPGSTGPASGTGTTSFLPATSAESSRLTTRCASRRFIDARPWRGAPRASRSRRCATTWRPVTGPERPTPWSPS